MFAKVFSHFDWFKTKGVAQMDSMRLLTNIFFFTLLTINLNQKVSKTINSVTRASARTSLGQLTWLTDTQFA